MPMMAECLAFALPLLMDSISVPFEDLVPPTRIYDVVLVGTPMLKPLLGMPISIPLLSVCKTLDMMMGPIALLGLLA